MSGNLEVIDIDEPGLVKPWLSAVKKGGGLDVLKRLLVIKTPREGRFHFVYRCEEEVEKSQKLACKRNPGGHAKTMIETRGEGGYILAPGSPPECHELNKPYLIRRGSFEDIPVITVEERALLLNAACSLNEYTKPKRVVSGRTGNGGNLPGDQYNRDADWEDVLTSHGWIEKHTKNGVKYWSRPGKTSPGTSATTNHEGTGLLYVFSSNASPFEAENTCTKFAAFALLNYGGDYSAAAYALSWAERLPLPDHLPKVPTMSPEFLPEAIRPWVKDIVERIQVPVEFVAVPVLVAFAAVVGRRLGIHPKKYDDWLVVPNLWGAIVARPGMMKSPALKEGLKPIERLAVAASEEHEKAQAESRASLQVAAHTIWGVVAGKLLASSLAGGEKIKRLVIVGVIGLVVGYSLDWVGLVPS